MANLLATGIRLTAKGFNIRRAKLFPAGAKLNLLRRVGAIENLREFTADFYCEYDSFRSQLRVEIAVTDDLSQIIGKTTHIAFLGQLYELNAADVMPPFGDRFSWLLFVVKKSNETFTG